MGYGAPWPALAKAFLRRCPVDPRVALVGRFGRDRQIRRPDELKNDPTIGRAVALRRAEMAMLDPKNPPEFAHPLSGRRSRSLAKVAREGKIERSEMAIGGISAGWAPSVFARSTNGRLRRTSPVAGRPAEGLLTEPTAVARPGARELIFMSSRPEASHLRALPDPYVNLSIHTAPDVRPFPWQSCQWANSVGFTRRSRSNQSRAPLVFRRNRLNLRRAQRMT
jgi:hypothetical protein